MLSHEAVGNGQPENSGDVRPLWIPAQNWLKNSTSTDTLRALSIKSCTFNDTLRALLPPEEFKTTLWYEEPFSERVVGMDSVLHGFGVEASFELQTNIFEVWLQKAFKATCKVQSSLSLILGRKRQLKESPRQKVVLKNHLNIHCSRGSLGPDQFLTHCTRLWQS